MRLRRVPAQQTAQSGCFSRHGGRRQGNLPIKVHGDTMYEPPTGSLDPLS